MTTQEWNRFAVNHFLDEDMESTRREYVRLLAGYGESPAYSKETKSVLLGIARGLREITLTRPTLQLPLV